VSQYERLSAQDASFLVFEDANSNTHMHVGGVSIFDGAGLTAPGGAVDIERIRAYVASRLHAIPRYRQRLATTPLEGEPIWIDDDRFNVRFHVRHTRLPRPGDDRELKRLTARILSQRLDRSRPLWEYWIIEGLQGGRFAALTKTHHCMIDGVSGVDISSVLMRLEPSDDFEPAPAWEPRPCPGRAELVRNEFARRVSVPAEIVHGARSWLRRQSWDSNHLRDDLAGVAKTLGVAWQGAAKTPINLPIGPHRRFDWTHVALDDAKRIKNTLGGTINDIVLATVAGALGEFLRRRRVNVDILDFISAVPVNTRNADDRSMGNQVSAWLARLPLAERDPVRRLEQVAAVTNDLKQSGGSNAASYLYQLAEWGGPVALGGVVELTRRLSPCNLVITNVPGPPFPLYVLGAKMLEAYPQVTLLEGQGLGVAVFSYCGRLQFGFNADWDLLPDLHDLVRDVERCFAELLAAANDARPQPSAARAGTAIEANL
jgi:WS/DGAT/MGAT family acyltransferase